MQAYSIETVIAQDGTLQLEALPFPAGEAVQIIILPRKRAGKGRFQPSLKGSVLNFVDPLEPVAQDDWSVMQ